MAARDPRVRSISSTIAALERHHPQADTSELRRQLHEAQAVAYVRRLRERPQAERVRLALLLLGGGDAA
jgi:hypothetical protein